jgi:hypothetical protein
MEQYIQPFISVCETVFHDFCQTEENNGRITVNSLESGLTLKFTFPLY